MGVTLAVQVASPITPEDLVLLRALSMAFVVMGSDDQPEPQPTEEGWCGSMEYAPTGQGSMIATGRTCIAEVGHKGRHRFREMPQPPRME